MNIARLFSYTRQVERERDAALERNTSLEQQLEARTSYAFALAGRPTPEIVKQREAAIVASKPGSVTPMQTYKSIRLLRSETVKDILAKREPNDGPMKTDEMAARADEFAEKQRA